CPPENKTSAPSSVLMPRLLDVAEVAARFPGAVAIDRNAGEATTSRGDLAPNPGREVLHRRRAKVRHVIEELMIQSKPRLFERTRHKPKITDHSGSRVGVAANDDLRPVRMSVDPPARLAIDCPVESVGRFEPELLAELEHQGIPTSLCIWTLS